MRISFGNWKSPSRPEFLISLQKKGKTDKRLLTSEAELIANLRAQLEALNDYAFSDVEWA